MDQKNRGESEKSEMTQRPVRRTLEEDEHQHVQLDEPEIVESTWIRKLEDLHVVRDNMASILEIKIHFAWAELQEISYTVVGLRKVEIYTCKY